MEEEKEQRRKVSRRDVRVRRGANKANNPTVWIVLVALVVGYVLGTRQHDIMATLAPVFGMKVTSNTLDFSSVQKTYQELKASYDGDLDPTSLINGASRGLVAAAGDPYTVYMDKKEADEFEKELSGNVGAGIGAEVGIRAGQPTLTRLLDDMPAKKAGLQVGDAVVAVNDEVTIDMALDKTVAKIRGEEGSTVKVTIKRGDEIKEFSIVRAKISNPSVRSEVKNNIGVITITRFDTETGDLARRAAQSLKNQGIVGVIIDLRDNGGGYVTAAQDVAGLWFDGKLIITEKTGGKVTDTVKSVSNGTPALDGLKTVVLINGGSASASEIIAGALHDYKIATLVGEKSYGKGTVQKVANLDDGSLLKVTIARWYTPGGRNITKEGIEPDKKVELTSKQMDAGQDPQMEAALGLF